MILIFAAASLLTLGSGPAKAQVSDETQCESSYQEGEYEKAVDCINSFLYSGAITDTARLIKAYEYLGVCLAMLEKKGPARAAFNKLLDLNQDYELNPNVYLPDVISLFQISKFQKRISLNIMILDTVPAYSPAFNFAPLGVPQYLNEEKIKSAAVFLAQAAALGLSVYGYRREQSFWSESYGFKEEDLAEARRYDALHKWSLLSFTLVYVYSLVDGFVNKRISVKQ